MNCMCSKQPYLNDNLIREYKNLVHYAIHRYYPFRPNVEYEDLFQIASIALVNAAVKYNPARGAGFATYALLHIRSALYREMRRNTAQKRRAIVVSLFQEIDESGTQLIDIIPDPATTEGYNLYQRGGRLMANSRSVKTEAGALTVTKLDLSTFVVFNANNALATRTTPYITVTKNGKVTLSPEVGKRFASGETLEILINPAATIAVVRSSAEGIQCRRNGKNTDSTIFSCAHAKLFLENKQVPLPAKFRAAWDEDLSAWVGRR
ncbi:hypothetical protein HSX37_16325|nr:sigma factor [Dendrosporobacter quercicolus]NSL49603.1 hypothetical protein [Dendrosporobacter quercicolus DSM 1736]